MKPSKSGFEPVWQTQHPAQCRELRLVLESVGIASQTIQQDGWWWLIVASEDLPVAAVEIEQYQLENHGNSKSQPLERTRVYSGAAAGVVGYISVILLVACLRIEAFFDRDWLLAGRMVAGPVTSGEWWRVITALTLHVDAEHIYSNLIFGAVFGFLAGRLLGGGIAWLGITLAGSFGNLLNAMIQSDDHSSIGASTAVFAALGVMVSHALFPMDKHENRFKRWSPLIAGIALLGFTGRAGKELM